MPPGWTLVAPFGNSKCVPGWTVPLVSVCAGETVAVVSSVCPVTVPLYQCVRVTVPLYRCVPVTVAVVSRVNLR